jgi:hypothetical protein
MIAILGLLILVAAGLVAVAGVASNSGSAHALGGDFTVAGLHLSGLSSGQLFLYGAVVGVVAMLGLSMLLGTFSRRLASRGSRRDLKESRRETETLRLDHERLTQELHDERNERQRTAGAVSPGAQTQQIDESAAVEPAVDAHPSLLQRIGHRAGPPR